MTIWVPVRCVNHFAPILPDLSGNVKDWAKIEGPDLVRCICGQLMTGKEADKAWNDYTKMYEEARNDLEDFWPRTCEKLNSPGKLKDPGHGEQDPSARWYLITCTQPDTIKHPDYVLKNMRKIIASKQIDPISWSYCLEHTEKGTPHTHAIVYTKKYFDYGKIKKFNRSPEGAQWMCDVQPEKWNVTNYTRKHETKPSPEWLQAHGLTEFIWYSENFPEELKYQPQV